MHEDFKIWAIIMWATWNARNIFVFEDKHEHLTSIFQATKNLLQITIMSPSSIVFHQTPHPNV